MRASLCFAVAALLAGCVQQTQTGAAASRGAVPTNGVAVCVDGSQTVTLEGNVHPLARAEFDQGVVNPNTRLERMMLLLKPSAAQQANLDALVEAQQNPGSPLYHQWLTPAEYGAQFGVSDPELALVTAWLTAQGFTVDEVPAGRQLVVFSGTAGQVFDAFRTEIHVYRVNGVAHLANTQDPQIPVALAGVVIGVVSLHDFRRTSEMKTRRAFGAQPQYTAGGTHYLFPADFAAIYDLNPLYSAGTAGTGSAIAIVGRSNINLSDVAAFRSMAGLTANVPRVIVDGTNPGLVATDQDESTLDVEWSGAVAPGAAVNLVAAASTQTTDGVDLASQYIVNHATSPVVSVSYGSCEREMGVAELAFYNSLWEEAASQGMSVFVASGDAGAAGCEAGADTEGSRNAVNGMCSSPYATCVGGTEFNEGANAAQYWSTTNSAGYGSALGHIPEEVWNESALDGGTGLWASGGGASTVYAQPAWQAEVNGASAANGMRAVPDVALSAADHDGYFMVENGSNWIVSGTSVAPPAFAGVMALVVDKQNGAKQGNANARLYALAAAAADPFHATPSGNNSVPGVVGFTADGAEYNLATGLGSEDGAMLVNGWGASVEIGPIKPPQNGCSRFRLLPTRCRPTLRTPLL
jgi:subtilase family serine protease